MTAAWLTLGGTCGGTRGGWGRLRGFTRPGPLSRSPVTSVVRFGMEVTGTELHGDVGLGGASAVRGATIFVAVLRVLAVGRAAAPQAWRSPAPHDPASAFNIR